MCGFRCFTGVIKSRREPYFFWGSILTGYRTESLRSAAYCKGSQRSGSIGKRMRFSKHQRGFDAGYLRTNKAQPSGYHSGALNFPLPNVSAYLLKIEPDTPYGKHPPVLPPEEEVAQLYLLAAEELEKSGFFQYETDNFAKEGYRCRHNQNIGIVMKYLGIGPAAHSYWNGNFLSSRNLEKF